MTIIAGPRLTGHLAALLLHLTEMNMLDVDHVTVPGRRLCQTRCWGYSQQNRLSLHADITMELLELHELIAYEHGDGVPHLTAAGLAQLEQEGVMPLVHPVHQLFADLDTLERTHGVPGGVDELAALYPALLAVRTGEIVAESHGRLWTWSGDPRRLWILGAELDRGVTTLLERGVAELHPFSRPTQAVIPQARWAAEIFRVRLTSSGARLLIDLALRQRTTP